MAQQSNSDSIIDLFKRLGQTLPIPNLDVERIIAHHRRNLEALEQSARATADGTSAMMTRQREMLESMISQATETARGMKLPSSPQEMMTSQVDLARRTFETAVENAGELGTMMQRSGTASIDILRDRIKLAMNELQDGFDPRPGSSSRPEQS
ncbi:TIGR01841 family phasin [Tianweitania sp. BSSL-BM11]|uniref:TIGR01841 family phasin n=1 Tax=Tianweitania aestuarii TaxID=2814886 RepID=A0ABS5RUX3_9HYPH|nr:TIGR01841 family phasin [Tianweitania aestuarii]MBS9720772.1 TIGR01841 family phasin [Tianweitania aestuarii]